jgi:hypothetical protein
MSFLDNNPLSFIFGAKPGAGVPTYTQLQMRRKIAESLLGQKSRYPKTFGEGLSAIGEAIGERGMLNKFDAMDQAYEGQTGPEYNRVMGMPPASATPTGRPMSYAPEDAGTGPVAAAATTGSNVGSWNQFAQEQSPGGLGLAPQQAAGLVGNLQAESGANINPNAPPGDNGTAFGSAQWRGPRLAALRQYAANQGLDPMTTAAQQGFMRQEMIGQGNKMPTEGGAYAGLTATNTPAGAATAVDRLYERSSGEHRGRRINNAQNIMRSLGPQSSVVDPGLNQSVALDQTVPPAPAGAPMAFSGAPASDAPPIGAPPDASTAITSALVPKPAPVVAPPVPPAPAPVQIAQAPPQPQIRVPEKEPVPPPAPQATSQMSDIAVLSGKLDPNDPRQRGLQLRYQQLQANQQADYTQKLEEYKHKRDRWESAPERALALKKAQQEVISDESPGQATPRGAAVLAGPDPRLGKPESPQRSGIPVLEPAPPGVIPAEWARDQAKKISETKTTLESVKPEVSETLDLMDKIRAHPGKARSIGVLGGVGAMTAEGKGFTALNEQLKGINLVAAYQKIRGTGQVGQKEGENVAKAQSALTTAATEKDYDAALNTLETTLRGAVERTERKLNRPVTAYQRTPDDPYAPDIGQLSRTGSFEYVGGDPQDKRNWKRVR